MRLRRAFAQTRAHRPDITAPAIRSCNPCRDRTNRAVAGTGLRAFSSNVADVAVDGAVGHGSAVGMYVFEQLIPGKDPARVFGECAQQPQLRGSQVQVLRAPAGPELRFVDTQRVLGRQRRRRFARGMPPGASKLCLHPRHHVARAVRFAQVVIGPGFQPQQPFDLFHPCGQHDDGHPTESTHLPFPDMMAGLAAFVSPLVRLGGTSTAGALAIVLVVCAGLSVITCLVAGRIPERTTGAAAMQ